MGENVIKSEDYSLLKDLRVKIEGEEEGFTLCFWLYLLKPSTFPAILINQVVVAGSAPFLALKDNKTLMLFPLFSSHKEVPDPRISTPWNQFPHASMEIEFPLQKWTHVGCKQLMMGRSIRIQEQLPLVRKWSCSLEVSTEFLRLHIDEEIVAEQSLPSSFSKDDNSNCLKKINFAGNDVRGYVCNAKVLPLIFSVKDHYSKDPPLRLAIDNSSASEIEEDSDGVWSIVGGKASCRRIFSLDVILLNAFDQPINKEMEVVASLLYADNGGPVEKTNDAEAPLLTSYDGIEYASCDRPSKILHGRASFKLKISQLSSKCDNRLFRIRFEISKAVGFSFLEVLSPPIRCISRNRNIRTSVICKKSPAATQPLSGSQSFDDVSVELQKIAVHEAKPSSLSKRVRFDQEKISTVVQPEGECNSHLWNAIKAERVDVASLNGTHINFEEADNSPSDSESTGDRNSSFKTMSARGNSVPDSTIFKYCLGNMTERSSMLKEIAPSSSDEEILKFAKQVAIYSGCSHHSSQIMMAKQLIEEGRKTWNLISTDNNHVHWDRAVLGIEEQFMKISCCSTRSLKQQDFEILKKIAGCQDHLAQENFENLWYWLYPVAFTLSREWINATWKSTSPKWIEGFITKEEAEYSLQGPRGLQQPGTFLLRFPTSRSWPHPDAGSLVITYVGSDYTLHHRLISVEFIYRQMEVKQLHDLLLAEPELTRLGRTIRSQ
ncbi:hypothetical protein Ddye_026413 [Dipteronia dyeriana]|uniref:SH2 domain-containing protein n=1 Tax=Dipteronia dyeriana TaxID=168575 RepID=A0AAD9TMY8_9ROSI|nr:hypothetical protein Ddye_026413 [Dipteronia dyeriana]